jgi:glycosyltransferase involved in cell wall biosynthesis
VQLVDDLNPGGLERFAIDLAIAHREAGNRSAIFCLKQRGALAGQPEAAGVPVEALGKPGGLHLPTLFKLRRALLRHQANVIHAHNPGVHHYAALAAKLAGVPVVVNTRHGVSSSTGARYNERYFRAVLRWTDKVIYVSRDSERYYTGAGIVPAAQGLTIWNGIPLARFLATPRPPRRGPIRLVTMGRLVPVKNHALLLESFAQIEGAELRIWGEGPLRAGLETLITRLGLGGRAFLPGHTSDSPAALADADAFVFSSTMEGLPMVILEALAAGLPIISTPVGGVPEVAPEGEVAWYAEPANYAATLRAALASGELESRGRRARELAIANYSIEAVQEKHESLFRQLLESK